jgi:hypothetical protein
VLVERRSRTTYRPTVTPKRSTHVDTFTGTTSSFSCTVFRKLAVCRGPKPLGSVMRTILVAVVV